MADWRQIQARIRKAKTSRENAPAQLAELYEKTRDAMVAFELARLHENGGNGPEAARWYTAAAQRFRRAQWKKKAEEALTRLGASPPAASEYERAAASESVREVHEAPAEQTQLPLELPAEKSAGLAIAASEAQPIGNPRRRRGRRGGRGRRRGKGLQSQPAPQPASAPPAPKLVVEEPIAPPPQPSRTPEPVVGSAAWQARSRTGEPALASRLALLESQLRRLIAGPLHPLDDAEQAPAGPGVLIVSDSEQTTYYYIAPYETLRYGVGNLLRAERGARKEDSLRGRFAEHLGISEVRVSKYLKEHCAVRWLQLDEGAPQLAHFAVAVLRPALND